MRYVVHIGSITLVHVMNQDHIVDDFTREVITRDGDRCLVTGTPSSNDMKLTATFICPPLVEIQVLP